jgi:hypothetical protein
MIAFPSWKEGDACANPYGDFAFELKEGKFDPLRPITTPGQNPDDSLEYDYWDHLDYIIDKAKSKGMHVILLPTWGSHVTGGWDGKDTSRIIFNSTSAYRHGQWIGQRLKNKTNLLWVMGGDRRAVYGERITDMFSAPWPRESPMASTASTSQMEKPTTAQH